VQLHLEGPARSLVCDLAIQLSFQRPQLLSQLIDSSDDIIELPVDGAESRRGGTLRRRGLALSSIVSHAFLPIGGLSALVCMVPRPPRARR
jgi:hypothetical protein